MFSKTIVVLAAAALAIAAPSRRDADTATCTYTFTPSGAVTADIAAEFNYTIGRSLAEEAPEHSVVGFGFQPTANSDGSYTASGPIGAGGWTAEEVEAAVTAWVGTDLNGLSVTWHVDSVTCA